VIDSSQETSAIQVAIIDALYSSVTYEDHGPAEEWPVWNFIRSQLVKYRSYRAADLDIALSDLLGGGGPSGRTLPLVWRANARRSVVVQPDEVVGLTLSGIAAKDTETADGIARMIGAAARYEASLEAQRNGMPTATWSINEKILRYLPHLRRAAWTQMNERVIAEVLRHEPIPLATDDPSGFQYMYVLEMGDHRLAPFLEVDDVAAYLEVAASVAPGRDILTGMTPDERAPSSTPRGGRTVFLVHGRNAAASDAMRDFLSALDLEVIVWEDAVGVARQQVGGPPTTLETVAAGLNMASGVVVLFTPDDQVRLHKNFVNDHDPDEEQLVGQARPNVILEAGMAWAMDKSKVEIVRLGKLRPISDIDGINFATVSDDPVDRNRLATRLGPGGLGLAVKTSSGRHLTVGSFGAAMSYTSEPPPFPLSSGSSPEREELLALRREITSLCSSAAAQGWRVRTKSDSTVRIENRKGVTFRFSIGKPGPSRVRLRRFAAELRGNGLRVNNSVRRPVHDTPIFA
jgi:predicted nucleotide-binding protein